MGEQLNEDEVRGYLKYDLPLTPHIKSEAERMNMIKKSIERDVTLTTVNVEEIPQPTKETTNENYRANVRTEIKETAEKIFEDLQALMFEDKLKNKQNEDESTLRSLYIKFEEPSENIFPGFKRFDRDNPPYWLKEAFEPTFKYPFGSQSGDPKKFKRLDGQEDLMSVASAEEFLAEYGQIKVSLNDVPNTLVNDLPYFKESDLCKYLKGVLTTAIEILDA